MSKRRFAIDFDELRPEALAWVMNSEKRKTLYKHRDDATIAKLFSDRYGNIAEDGNDLVPDRIIVTEAEAIGVKEKWLERMRFRLTKNEGRNEASLDPMTLWLIGEVIYFLIQWWLDNRRKRIRKTMGS